MDPVGGHGAPLGFFVLEQEHFIPRQPTENRCLWGGYVGKTALKSEDFSR